MFKKYLILLFGFALMNNYILLGMEDINTQNNLLLNNQKQKIDDKSPHSLKELICQKILKHLFEGAQCEDFLASEFFNWSSILTQDLKKDLACRIIKNFPATFWNCFMCLAQISNQEFIIEENLLAYYCNSLGENFFKLELSFEFFIEQEKIDFKQIDQLNVNMTLGTKRSSITLDNKLIPDFFIIDIFKTPSCYKFIDKNFTQILFLNIDAELKGFIRTYSIGQVLDNFDLAEVILIKFFDDLHKKSGLIKIKNKNMLQIFNNFPKQIQDILIKKFNIIL